MLTLAIFSYSPLAVCRNGKTFILYLRVPRGVNLSAQPCSQEFLLLRVVKQLRWIMYTSKSVRHNLKRVGGPSANMSKDGHFSDMAHPPASSLVLKGAYILGKLKQCHCSTLQQLEHWQSGHKGSRMQIGHPWLCPYLSNAKSPRLVLQA